MKKTIQLITSLISLVLGGASAQAALSYWDSNGATPGAGATPTGTWGVDSFWSADPSGSVATAAWNSGDTAVFSAGTDAVNPFTVTVSGTQTAGGITFTNGGEATLTGGTITMGVNPFPIAANTNGTINSVLAGTGTTGLTKTGPGTLTLNGANTYPGVTTVSAGVLAVGNSSALGTAAGNTVISSGAAVQISGGIGMAEQLAAASPATGIANDGAVRNVSGSNAVDWILISGSAGASGRVNIDSGTLFVREITAPNRTTLTLGGNGDSILCPSSPVFNVDGLFWGGDPGNVIKEGNGTTTLNGQCQIRGTWTISAGTAKWGNSNRFGNGGNVIPDMSITGTWDLNGFSESVDGLIGAGSVINAGTSSLTNCAGVSSGTHVASPNFSGVISGGTTLVKQNAARTQTLSGNNTYTGNTIINAGTLALAGTGSISNSPVISVASGATFDVSAVTGGFVLQPAQTLMGYGTVTGAVIVASGGHISPGASPGILTNAGGLDLSAGGIYTWELAANSESSPGVNFDQIVMTTGTLTLGGSSTLNIQFISPATAPDSSNPFWQSARSWTVISASGAASTFATIQNGSYAAGNFTAAANGGGIVLTFSPPAPPPVVRPQITSLVGAGTASVAVNYTNTIVGTNYVVQYTTNLGPTPNWNSLSPVTAVGTSSSSTDTVPAPGNTNRMYRVYYTP